MTPEQDYANACPRCGHADEIIMAAVPYTYRIAVAIIECRVCGHYEVRPYAEWARQPFIEVIRVWNKTLEDGTI